MISKSSLVKTGFFLILILLLVMASYGKAFEMYFWKDDWAWLWSSNFNPNDFFHSTIGENWVVRTGVFMYPYVLFLHKVIRDNADWQLIGLTLKFVNSLLFYTFVYSFTKKKQTALWGAALYAVYSGGVESYTWHKLNALATSFILAGFIFFSRFQDTQKIKAYLAAYLCFVLAMFSYMGRSAGIASVCVFWGILTLLDRRIVSGKKVIAIGLSLIIIPYIFTVRWVSTQQAMPAGYMVTALQNNHNFFGIIGNLLKNPFKRTHEIGYLIKPGPVSHGLGYGLFAVGLILGLIYLRKQNDFLKYALLFIGWIFLFYFPNWIYGGGGITTFLGSGHRYLAVSGIGVVGLWVLILEKIKKPFGLFCLLGLIVLNLRYSEYLLHMENSVRNRYIVEPIYRETFKVMQKDDNVQFIILDTPNDLASFVVGGWYPYAYAYHKGLKEVTQFPVVVADVKIAMQWGCAKTVEEKKYWESLGGFGNNQNILEVDPQHTYAWSLNREGHLIERTDGVRATLAECQKLRF